MRSAPCTLSKLWLKLTLAIKLALEQFLHFHRLEISCRCDAEFGAKNLAPRWREKKLKIQQINFKNS